MSPDTLQESTIVVTGVTGQVARPLAVALARDNRVVGAARFNDAAARAELEAAGIECVPVDLVGGDLGALPEDADYVLNFAVAKTNDWERDLAANAGGLAYLMEHHRRARALLHCSSTAVYKPAGHRVFTEDSPLGDNHGVWPFLRTYSICKIAAEGTARWGAERFGLPTTIARLSVPYGDNGGWPAIHLHMLLSGHAVPAVTVNWGGSEPVSIEEWCAYLAGLVGVEARFEPTNRTIDSVQIDTSRMHELAGRTTVPWREGMRRMATALHPDKFR